MFYSKYKFKCPRCKKLPGTCPVCREPCSSKRVKKCARCKEGEAEERAMECDRKADAKALKVKRAAIRADLEAFDRVCAKLRALLEKEMLRA